MTFRASFCDPLKPDIIELGDIPQDNIVAAFQKIPWTDFLQKMTTAKENEIYFSPSFEVENKESRHGLAISAVGDYDNFEFYIFYKRPKLVRVKKLFSSKEEMDDNYTTDVTGQTNDDVVDCLNALTRNDTAYLDNKIGQ
jgi:hypothetical protein